MDMPLSGNTVATATSAMQAIATALRRLVMSRFYPLYNPSLSNREALMRRIVVCLTLMLLASSPSQAAPMLPGEFFTPESVFLDIDPPLFENGTNTFCWLCSDSDPGNDLKLVLSGRVGTLHAAGFPDFFTADSLGTIDVSGSQAPSFAGLNVSFSFQVMTTITTKVNPDHSTEPLPRPSVAKGVINGAVIGLPRPELELHYSGRVDGVTFLESSIFPFVVPIEGGSKGFTSEIFVDPEVAYTPGLAPPSVVPEPFSLLLLSSGLAAAVMRRRKGCSTPP